MATSLIIEIETGTFSGHEHPHNGYYAGDFTNPRSGAVTTLAPRSS